MVIPPWGSHSCVAPKKNVAQFRAPLPASDSLVARAVRTASRVPRIDDQRRRPFSVERVVESCSANKHAALAAHVPGSTRAFVLRSPEPKENALNVRLAVNGTLMRGLALNGNLLAAGATFVRET